MKQAKLLTQAEQKRVNALINAHRYSARNHAIFAISFFAGLRACEIAALKVGDVFEKDGSVRDTVYLAAGQTKGDEANTVLVSKRLDKALAAYAAAYPHHVSKPEAALFFSAKRGGFSAQTIVNLFSRFYALAGIKGASSHSGRRQFLTELADKGVNVRVIQALARHKDISTTQRYIDYNESKLRNAIELVSQQRC
ncbi:tyrosine-type recombinase/integrase [Sedimentimonas flavescens]|uniref:tyrosine-type recombinase/integrase n=1 Tax=Sedimentimonas flavescens TaxID=2851012 RepID=UPI001C4A62DF|nr:site-specific integrase [Sedimentimonas flavescens]MBW0158734.1 site-specific integrase [Sedimentimonas flavescens]